MLDTSECPKCGSNASTDEWSTVIGFSVAGVFLLFLFPSPIGGLITAGICWLIAITKAFETIGKKNTVLKCSNCSHTWTIEKKEKEDEEEDTTNILG